MDEPTTRKRTLPAEYVEEAAFDHTDPWAIQLLTPVVAKFPNLGPTYRRTALVPVQLDRFEVDERGSLDSW